MRPEIYETRRAVGSTCCGQGVQKKLTLSHEGGSAIVKRVHLLCALAVSVGAHVKSLGPLLEEHLAHGQPCQLARLDRNPGMALSSN